MSDTSQTCHHCGGTNIRENMKVAMEQQTNWGIGVTIPRTLRRPNVLPFAAHVCKDCGTVVRLFLYERYLEELNK